jgi:hypothetical protein
MKWAMSDDYAALVTTVILAVLLIGSVQAYTLFRTWGDGIVEAFEDLTTSIDNVVQAGRSGQEPSIEDLAKIDKARVSGPNHMMRRKVAALLAFTVWVAICVVLVVVEIEVLKWSATHSPEDHPGLAKFAFYACAASVVILVAEGAVRVMARTAISLKKEMEPMRAYTAEDRRRYDEALHAFRQAQEPPSGPTT